MLVSTFQNMIRNGQVAFYAGGSGYLSFTRWALLTRFGRKLPQAPSALELDEEVAGEDYSRRAVRHYRPNRRTLRLLSLLKAALGDSQGRLLIVGPRYENEIFMARGLGWSAENISALDRLSYSPLVTQGDMHSIPFHDSYFSAVTCGWTLSYSRDPERAALEMSRVLAPGGFLAVGVAFVDRRLVSTDISGALIGEDRIQDTGQVEKLFGHLELVAHLEAGQIGGDSCWLLRKRNH